MNPKLFQSAEFYHRRYHNFATLLVLPMTIFLIFLIFVLFNRKKEITVTSVGSLRPKKIIDVVQSTSNNTVIDNQLLEIKWSKKEICSLNTPTKWKTIIKSYPDSNRA